MRERNMPAYSALRRMLLHWGSILFFYLDRSSINPGTSGAQTVPVYRTHWKKARPRQGKKLSRQGRVLTWQSMTFPWQDKRQQEPCSASLGAGCIAYTAFHERQREDVAHSLYSCRTSKSAVMTRASLVLVSQAGALFPFIPSRRLPSIP